MMTPPCFQWTKILTKEHLEGIAASSKGRVFASSRASEQRKRTEDKEIRREEERERTGQIKRERYVGLGCVPVEGISIATFSTHFYFSTLLPSVLVTIATSSCVKLSVLAQYMWILDFRATVGKNRLIHSGWRLRILPVVMTTVTGILHHSWLANK